MRRHHRIFVGIMLTAFISIAMLLSFPSTSFAVQTTSSVRWSRLAGDRALDTMTSIVGAGWQKGGCDTVVIATMDGFWDALTASGFAGIQGCPVLQTAGSTLSSQTASEIQWLGAKTAYIAGGPAAVSTSVEEQVQELGVSTIRLQNNDAVGTAIQIYDEGAKTNSWGDTAIIATAETFQDALAVSPYAYAKHAPIFLAYASTHMIDERTIYAIKTYGFKNIIICGGSMAVSDNVETKLKEEQCSCTCVRLAGATAYETSSKIATHCIEQGMSADGMAVATGDAFYDALSGASFCGKHNAALVLIADYNRSAIGSFVTVNKGSISTAYVLGGPAAVTDASYAALVNATK